MSVTATEASDDDDDEQDPIAEPVMKPLLTVRRERGVEMGEEEGELALVMTVADANHSRLLLVLRHCEDQANQGLLTAALDAWQTRQQWQWQRSQFGVEGRPLSRPAALHVWIEL